MRLIVLLTFLMSMILVSINAFIPVSVTKMHGNNHYSSKPDTDYQNIRRITPSNHLSFKQIRYREERLTLFSSKEMSTDSLSSDLETQLKEYLSKRDNDENNALSPDNIELKKKYQSRGKKETSFFDMVKPSGWYKDNVALDLESRMDGRIPLAAHPFSYIELQKYGYETLYDDIVTLGGPHAVAKMIGFDWQPPEEPSEWTEDMRPVVDESYGLYSRGELVLGGGLDDRLEAAANIDVAAIKAKIAEKQSQVIEDEDISMEVSRDNQKDIDYTNIKKTRKSKPLKVRKLSPEELAQIESFTLRTPERLYSVFVLAIIAGANGRATTEFLSRMTADDSLLMIRDISQYVSFGLAGISVGFAVACVKKAESMNRSQWIWALTGLIGGPVALNRLSQMTVRDKESERKS